MPDHPHDDDPSAPGSPGVPAGRLGRLYRLTALSARTGASLVVWGVLLRIVVVMQMTFLANSAGHRFGLRRHLTRMIEMAHHVQPLFRR